MYTRRLYRSRFEEFDEALKDQRMTQPALASAGPVEGERYERQVGPTRRNVLRARYASTHSGITTRTAVRRAATARPTANMHTSRVAAPRRGKTLTRHPEKPAQAV